MRSRWCRSFMLSLVLATPALFAQGGSGTITGILTDTGGAVVELFVDWDHMEYLRLLDYRLTGVLQGDSAEPAGAGLP